MKVAYADPPYIGQANKYPEKQEVDHVELIAKLEAFDGWALSASSPSIYDIVPMFLARGIKPRIGAWVKRYCVFKPNNNPAYAWEPIFFKPARDGSRKKNTVRDWVSANITIRKGLVGAKPPEFCGWLFDLLGMETEDEFYDLFLGTGIVTSSWEIWRNNRRKFE